MAEFYSVYYDKGGRENNQDSIAVHKVTTVRGELLMALISDGCGGMDDGDIASGYIAEQLSVWFYEELTDMVKRRGSIKKIERSLNRKLFTIHERLKKHGAERNRKTAATLNLLIITGNRYMICYLGDSPGVLLKKKCRFLTAPPYRDGVITKCVGNGKFFYPLSRYGTVKKGTAFMLMSDGFGRHMEDERIWGALLPGRINSSKAADKTLKTLGEMLKKGGEYDNISAVYIKN